jgi:hypothetical protein
MNAAFGLRLPFFAAFFALAIEYLPLSALTSASK